MSIKTKIQTLIAAANAKTGASDTTLTDAVQTLVDGYGQGGGEITDGIVVKARDADGWATEIDVYASDGIVKFWFSTANVNSYGWWKLEKVNFKSPFTKIRSVSFAYLTNIKEITGLEELTGSLSGNLTLLQTQIRELILPNFESDTGKWVICSRNSALKRVYLPKYKSFSHDGNATEVSYCTGLETVEIGSIGYPVSPTIYTFKGCTQTGLTITAYSTSAKSDTVLSSIRNGATNATIIIKDSTTGEIIVTSTP